jgi:hypothetical protein
MGVSVMHPYLSSVDHAVKTIIRGMLYEHQQVSSLDRQIKRLIRDFPLSVETLVPTRDLDAPRTLPPAWRKRLLKHGVRSLDDLEVMIRRKLEAHDAARAALAGALLQIVRQGISMVHRGPQDCPKGRMLGTQPLKDVVWQARNQAVHYEEQKLSKEVRDCFNQLALDFPGRGFDDPFQKNLAFEIAMVLGWTEVVQFQADVERFLSP